MEIMSKTMKGVTEDRMSELPAEILVRIVLELSLKEAGRTSTLSRKWKTLWRFADNLDFTDSDCHVSNQTKAELLVSQNKYTEWVNQVVNSHHASAINGFKVCFDLNDSYKSHLDAWIQFALQKKVVNLHFDLYPNKNRTQNDPYHFPTQILNLESNLKILRVLRLCGVDVSTPVLQDILSICTCLEAISIAGSHKLTDAKFCGLLKLKSIEMQDCNKLKAIEISAGDLESLVCFGRTDLALDIHHAPKLDTVYLGGYYLCRRRIPMISDLSSCFSQMKKLVLDFTVERYVSRNIPVYAFPDLKNLEWLELMVQSRDNNGESLLYCLSMTKACPMLKRFGVEFHWIASRSDQQQTEMEKIELGEKLTHLKVVEFKWFGGRRHDVELAISVLDNAPNIETLTFDTCYVRNACPGADKIDTEVDRMIAKDCARNLSKKHSPKATLIVY